MVYQKASTEIAMKRRVYRIILYTYLGNTGVYVCCNNTFSQVQVVGQGFLQPPLSKLPLALAHLDLRSLTSMLICLTPHPTPFLHGLFQVPAARAACCNLTIDLLVTPCFDLAHPYPYSLCLPQQTHIAIAHPYIVTAHAEEEYSYWY